jgi:(1->4)-alpha-D-glucan 1-alpha-D-glucosylmutase
MSPHAPPAPRSLRATYRLQLRAEFGFHEATQVVGYLADLGVSHVYVSPSLQAAPGSAHGYDGVDPSRVNAELGGDGARTAFVRALREHGLGQIQDIVPNHLALAGRDNPWWWHVLERGVDSKYAKYFDIDWEPAAPELFHKVLVPTLPDRYGRLVEQRKIKVVRADQTLAVTLDGQEFPVRAETVRRLFDDALNDASRVDAALDRINASPELLDGVLEEQHYRLCFWRSGAARRNYRRFFDIDSLAALRADRDDVFRDTHAVILSWLEDGSVDGVRVDHIDGLRDPEAYLKRLSHFRPSAYVFVEKILEPDERLPPSWPVHGTTGYDFLNRLEGLFIDPAGEAPLTELYARFTGRAATFANVAYDAKRLVMATSLSADVAKLVALLERNVKRRWQLRDTTRPELEALVTEFLARLPVYRTYSRPSEGSSRPEDERVVQETMRAVRAALPHLDDALLGFMTALVLGSGADDGTRDDRDERAAFRLALQETSGPVMAKGVEDTAFYRYFRLTSLNEVGGDPGRFGTSLEAFHRENAACARAYPEALLATATHDTKRGEDVRARLDLLSEVPDAWAAAVERWSARAQSFRSPLVDPNDEYLFYQTWVGAYPISVARLQAYLSKAVKESKTHSSWQDPNTEYEEALAEFVERALGDDGLASDVASFAATLVEPGRIVGLAKKLIALTAPGVPDLYQGTELWDLNLVDPDNRRPVDYTLRRRLLAELAGTDARTIWARADSGLPKLWVVKTALDVRRRFPASFDRRGTYEPLHAEGRHADRVVAFQRGDDVVTVAPRLVMRRDGFAETTLRLPDGEWTDAFSERRYDGMVAMGALFDVFPVVLLIRTNKPS